MKPWGCFVGAIGTPATRVAGMPDVALDAPLGRSQRHVLLGEIPVKTTHAAGSDVSCSHLFNPAFSTHIIAPPAFFVCRKGV